MRDNEAALAAQAQHAMVEPLEHILGRLKQVRKWGGNYLINAAPRADGTVPEAFYERMAGVAALGGFARLDEAWRDEERRKGTRHDRDPV